MGTHDKSKIEKEARRILEGTTYSSETQFDFAKHWRRMDLAVSVSTSVLAAVSGLGSLANVLPSPWPGVIAILAAGMGAVSASVGAPRSKERASISANAYRALQQDVRIFLDIDLETMDPDEARNRLQELVDRQQALNSQAEIPSKGAWSRAKRQIEGGSQSYEADKR